MAYMNQEMKKKFVPQIKTILKKYGLKGTVGVENYSTLVVNVYKGPLEFNMQFDHESFNMRFVGKRNCFVNSNKDQPEDVNAFFVELSEAMNATPDGSDVNYDNSRIEIDHHDVGWYATCNIGKWNKPYICTK